MTRKTENTTDLAIPPALAAQLYAAAEEQRRTARDVLRDALEGYLRAWRPFASTRQRSPAEAAARMMHARQGNVRLDDAALLELMTHGRA
jgi:hypothetical protein